MSRKALLLFPGNPGFAEDFTPLLTALALPEQMAVGFYRMPLRHPGRTSILLAGDRALAEAQMAEDGADLRANLYGIAYSFGAYGALRWAKERGLKWRVLIVINPYFVGEKPVSKRQRLLAGTPLLGTLLLNRMAGKLARDFVARCFAPQSVDDASVSLLQSRLSRGSVWRSALHQKLIQERHPLRTSLRDTVDHLVVIRGAADSAVDSVVQEAVLEKIGFHAQHIHTIDGAGHSLIWTNQNQVLPLIAAAFAGDTIADIDSGSEGAAADHRRIGYQHGKVPRNNVLSHLYDHVRDFPHRVAIRWVEPAVIAGWSKDHRQAMTHQEVTFLQFMYLVDAAAAGLSALGITKGDRVIIFLPMSMPMYVAMFAVQKLGAIAVFLDSWARSSHLGASATCATPKAMISHKAAFDLISNVTEFSTMLLRIVAGPGPANEYTASFEQLLQTKDQVPIAAVTGVHSALITFTTGSSGTPKGANRTHRFLCAQHEALAKIIPYTSADIDMPAFPIFSLNNLASGVTTVLPALNLAAPSASDGAALVSQILHEAITCTTLSPSVLNGVSRYCLEHAVTLHSLRRVVTGGAPISRDDVASFRLVAPEAKIWILYGSTEVEPMAHIEAEDMLAGGASEDKEVIEEGVNVGHISSDLRYKFIHIVRGDIKLSAEGWDHLEVGAGEIGEFIVTGDHVCRDYYNNVEAFLSTKIVDNDGAVWHRTGDLGRLDERGYLWIVGRIHNAIQRDARYYFPVRAEVLLKRLSFVEQGAFLGMPDSTLGECNAVALQLRANMSINLDAIAEIKRIFAKNSIPVDSIYVVDHIPMDPRHHSKVEYAVLRAQISASKVQDHLV